MKKCIALLVVFSLGLSLFANGAQDSSKGGPTPDKPLVLRYGHMNAPGSVNGLQAEYFAKRIKEETKGAIQIQVFPSSQLGGIAELAEAISTGAVAMSHNTFGGLQSLLDELGLFDTPYLYRNVDHLLKATDPETSPVLKELNQKLIAARKTRILYAFYFGTRELTSNKPAYKPEDLKGIKIRAIPSPIYQAAVEGMGAVAVPIDWSEISVALSTGVVSGQENPVDTIFSNNLNEVQKYIMMTDHIIAAEPVVINEGVWQALSAENKAIFLKVAKETRDWASNKVRDSDAKELQGLKDRGMTVIDEKAGLQKEAFRLSVQKVVNDRFGTKWGSYYKQIADIK